MTLWLNGDGSFCYPCPAICDAAPISALLALLLKNAAARWIQRRTRADNKCQKAGKGWNCDAVRNPGPGTGQWRLCRVDRPLIPGSRRDFFAVEDCALRAIFERLGRGLPARAMERKLRSLPVEELQVKLRKLLTRSGLSEEDVETFLRMDPRQALELLLGVMRGR